MATSDLTAERLRDLLHYDPKTGVFTSRKTGERIGRLDRSHGYVAMHIFSRKYYAHRLAWLYSTLQFPEHQIDHINGVRDDNRIVNLRDAPRSLNQQNRRAPQRNNRSGVFGIYKDRNKWRAEIHSEGVKVSLGSFASKDDAAQAYLNAKRQLHAGCTI
jgi:hypothetical protein